MVRVATVGDALIDVLRDDHGVREFVGGAALNVAIGLRVLGVDATLFAVLGSDEDGARVRAQLGAFGVELVDTPAPAGTGRAESVRSAGGEPQYRFTQTSVAPIVALDPAARMALAGVAGVVVSGVPFQVRSHAADLRAALAGHPCVVVDSNPRAARLPEADVADFRAGFLELAAIARLVKLGDDDALLLGYPSVAAARNAALAAGARLVLTTLGADGARFDGPELAGASVSAPIADMPGRIRDTMGAGDAVLATVTAALVRETPNDAEDWQRVLDDAMRNAAATCRHEGALLRVPPVPGAQEYQRIAT